MPGTIYTPSGDMISCSMPQSEDVYSCSHCKQVILPPADKNQNIYQLIQSHLLKCMPSSSLQDNLSHLLSAPRIIPPLSNLCMPLQPRRTWSAEDERRRRLEEDLDAYDVGPHSVTCAGCHRPIRLNATGRYYAANWNKHKMGCKNTNDTNGASAMSAESKFTGRVAAFRVAKPAEIYEPFLPSTSTGMPPPHELNHLHAPALGSSHFHSSARVHSRSQIDRSTSRGEIGHLAMPPNVPSARCPSPDFDRRPTETLNGPMYSRRNTDDFGAPYSGRSESLSKMDDLRRLRSPNGPPPRLEEREAHGPVRSPLSERYEKYGQAPRAMPLQRYQESIRLRHPGDVLFSSSYPPVPGDLVEVPQTLHKGKARLIEFAHSDSVPVARHPLLRHQAYPKLDEKQRSDLQDWVSERDRILHPYSSQEEASQFRMQASRARTVGKSDALWHLRDASATSSPEFSSARTSDLAVTAASPRRDTLPRSQGHFVGRDLPPLSSITFAGKVDPVASSGRISDLNYNNDLRRRESHANADFSGKLHNPPTWRERTSAWVQAGTARSASGRDSPESVVLPPIRTATNSPQINPSDTKRRQRECDEYDGISMNDDKPSPPKVLVLPMDPSRLSSTLKTEDLLVKYNHASPSSDGIENVGGDSMPKPLVGNQSEPSTNLENVRKTPARLHPVWKWERKQDVQLFNRSDKGNDVVMQ